MTARTPRVSVIMANYNGAAHIAAAVRSVLRSTETALELIVSDDGSQDESTAIVRGIRDARTVLLQSEISTGPAAARNRALAVAKADWIAIVDSDDFIHPERLERLLNAAARDGADIVADDLLTFYEDGSRQPHAHMRPFTGPRWISAAAYARSNRILGSQPALGYLKPLFRRLGPDGLPVAYDESLRIAEDSDLIQRLLIAGARMRVYPELGYFYRKHAASISHRLGAGHIDAMAAALKRWDASDPDLARELSRSRLALNRARAFAGMVDALKARKLGEALQLAMRQPSAAWLFKDALTKRVLPKPGLRPKLPGRRIALLSRQRIVGQTNGSSSYVLALAGALRGAGYTVDYIGPSPLIFGRWAIMKLKPETAVFDRFLVRGGVRVGNLMLARDPGVWLASALAVADRVLGKLGLGLKLSKPAQYAQGAEATRDDMLFIARHAAREAAAVFCDYCFLTPMAPYTLSPDARIFTIMHDLMSARVADKAEANTVKLDAKTEFRLLGLSDTVVAIQKEEADAVRAALPQTKVTLAFHAVQTVAAAQPGEDDNLLFVGSNTAPNVVGLEWFFRDVWPHVLEKRPSARLSIAGSVARALSDLPHGVRALGVVPDLAPLYAEAGVVISPLYTGSGLKIKLVEALAAGKAVVGTSVTTQGVEDIVGDAMIIADEPRLFAAAVVALLSDKSARSLLANSALACAEANFSPDATFAALLRDVRRDVQSTARDARELAQLTQ